MGIERKYQPSPKESDGESNQPEGENLAENVDVFILHVSDDGEYASTSESSSSESSEDDIIDIPNVRLEELHLFDCRDYSYVAVTQREQEPTFPQCRKKDKINRRLGKKKARRLENARELDLLAADFTDEDDIMFPMTCFRFSQILKDHNISEKILNPVEKIGKIDKKGNSGNTNEIDRKPKKVKALSASAAFNNLSANEKSLFKKRGIPLGMVEYLDCCVTEFFEKHPNGTYISDALSSFERLILHGIAHYYRLRSYSFDKPVDRLRLIKVTNLLDTFCPPKIPLCKYVEKECRKKSDAFQVLNCGKEN